MGIVGGGAVYLAVSVMTMMMNPDIPTYQAEVLNWPRFTFKSLYELEAIIHTSLRIRYNNHVTTDVHAATIDLYYPDWNGQLTRIGQVQDQYQQQRRRKSTITSSSTTANKNSTATAASTSSSSSRGSKSNASVPFWTMVPRSLFQQDDRFRYTMPISSFLRIAGRLVMQACRRGGWVTVPAGGVTQIKSLATKFTLLMVCDTDLNIVTLGVVGNNCKVYRFTSGWTNLTTHVEELRNHMHSLTVNATTGTVLVSKNNSRQRKENVINKKQEEGLEEEEEPEAWIRLNQDSLLNI